MWFLPKAHNKTFSALLLLYLLSSLLIHVITSILTDYACTGDDWSVIDKIRNEPSDKRYLVSIDDGYLKKAELLSLLTPGEFIGDEVSIYSFVTRIRYFIMSSIISYNHCMLLKL
jgi:hypothetical protein